MMAAIDADIVSDTTVFVYDGIADIAAMTDADSRQSMRAGLFNFFDGFIEIYTHKIAADDGGAGADAGAYTDDAVFDARCIDDTAFGDDGLFEGGAADFSGRQHTGPGIDGFFVVEKIEVGNILGQSEVGF